MLGSTTAWETPTDDDYTLSLRVRRRREPNKLVKAECRVIVTLRGGGGRRAGRVGGGGRPTYPREPPEMRQFAYV